MNTEEIRAENLRELLRQHWEHCRHLETERYWGMNVYLLILAAVFAFIGNDSSGTIGMFEIPSVTGPLLGVLLCFVTVITVLIFFLTIRWTHAFECHRIKVNQLTRILWNECCRKEKVDPTMNIPALEIIPGFVERSKTLSSVKKPIDELFRTRYWFAMFYFVMLVSLITLSWVLDDNSSGIMIAARVVGILSQVFIAFLGCRWYISLKQLERDEKNLINETEVDRKETKK